MESQSKQDLIAGGAIVTMFLGAFILSVSSLGLVLITSGAVAILLLIIMVVRKER